MAILSQNQRTKNREGRLIQLTRIPRNLKDKKDET
jgi:hypothetical protein